ncbi:helix-turn-helix domain-containing protein [Nocardia cyriacigeorgica]|uniref:MmyB family transcriptional regulator n=1 Tax=Nocardia cyriacigeorgica TaxID=135487 RepID=UPI00189603D3|nr:helix-turn-helix transcriptional regulator [Nocardia cyriacigeorgica]MBF6397821.1 helix-turn-helix domain-containing protein [Nocardia cyriacigeorgica]MBF6402521.1 helix-turn-helix domain-containing protein [Nocardia cyriacigeorgica]
MPRNPARRPRPTDHERPHIPTLGTACLQIRNALGISRATAYLRHSVSTTYLAAIENDRVLPSLEVLDQLITGYRCDPHQARYLRELRVPAVDLEPPGKLQQLVAGDSTLMAQLADLTHRGILAAYVDPLWNILACNDGFRAALPGIEAATDCIPAWLFTPAARKVLVEWEAETARAIATTKPVLARYRDSIQVHDIMRRLTPNKDFQRLWTPTVEVIYGRPVTDLLHIRDPNTGTLTSLHLVIAEQGQPYNIQLLIATPQPYSGPPDHKKILNTPTRHTGDEPEQPSPAHDPGR